MKIFIGFVSLFTSMAGLVAQSPTAAADSEAPKGDSFVQILNGVAPRPVTLTWEGGPTYENIVSGTRISAIPVKAGEITLKVKDEQTKAEKFFKLRIEPKSSNTLFLIGNFSQLPQADSKLPLDYNLTASVLKNQKPNGTKVNVTVINGLAAKKLSISEHSVMIEVPPGEVGVAKDLPPELTLNAKSGTESTTLYLAQPQNPVNLAVIFFEKDGHLAFRATTEHFQ